MEIVKQPVQKNCLCNGEEQVLTVFIILHITYAT